MAGQGRTFKIQARYMKNNSDRDITFEYSERTLDGSYTPLQENSPIRPLLSEMCTRALREEKEAHPHLNPSREKIFNL
jgi:hypothetical protein